MKIITILLSAFVLSGCIDFKNPVHQKSTIEIDSVDEIYIKKKLDGTDSIRLNKEQIELFVKEWNSARSEGLYKTGADFWVFVKLKNDSVRRFRTSGRLIKEKNDWTYSFSDSILISSFWESKDPFARPEDYDPISFINEVSLTLKPEKDTTRTGMTMIGDFPADWVKEEDIDSLIKLIDSSEECGCFLNALSSHIPTDDYAEKGGYAGIFIQAYKENRKVDLGLYACPKVDEKLNTELINWWKERK